MDMQDEKSHACIFCFETCDTGTKLDLHPTKSWKHYCHSECFQDFQVHFYSQADICPLCKHSIDPRVLIWPRIKVTEDNAESIFDEAIARFSYVKYPGVAPLIRLLSRGSQYEYPAKDSEACEIWRKKLRSYLSKVLPLWLDETDACTLLSFGEYCDDPYLVAAVLNHSVRTVRTLQYGLISWKIFKRVKLHYLIFSAQGPYLKFYVDGKPPDKRIVKSLHRFGFFCSSQNLGSFLGEVAKYESGKKWAYWAGKLTTNFIDTPCLRPSMLYAVAGDKVEILKWISRYYRLANITLVNYLLMAVCLDSIQSFKHLFRLATAKKIQDMHSGFIWMANYFGSTKCFQFLTHKGIPLKSMDIGREFLCEMEYFASTILSDEYGNYPEPRDLTPCGGGKPFPGFFKVLSKMVPYGLLHYLPLLYMEERDVQFLRYKY